MIAHRLSTIQKADQIVVMELGEIIERAHITNCYQKTENTECCMKNKFLNQLNMLGLKVGTRTFQLPMEGRHRRGLISQRGIALHWADMSGGQVK